MLQRVAFSGLLIGLSVCSFAASVATVATEEKALLKIEVDSCDAFRTGNVELLRKILDPTFTLISSRSEITNREQNLDEARKGDPKYSEFRNHDMNVRVYGDTAIVIGITSLKGTSGGESFELDVRFTDTFIKRDGQWRMIAGHVTRLTKPN